MKFHCVLAALLWMAGRILAVEEVPYAIAKEPWADGLGNHRAVLRAEQKADAVFARIPWRRRDRDPERKDLILLDATTGLRVTNVARFSDDRFEGVLAFQPQTVPGDYFVYYLPYPPEKGWGSYTLDYFKPQDKADPAWKATVAQASAPAGGEAASLASPTNAGGTPALRTLPAARLLRLEARTEFDSFYPMEVVATPEEVQAMLDRSAAFTPLQRATPSVSGPNLERPGEVTLKRPEGRAPYLLFPEDRRFPIRMKDELPLRWVKSGPTNVFRGEAQRNEFFVFQIGVWAARTNLAGLDVEFSGEIAKWLRCFNTGGTNWDGQPFHKTLAVAQGRVQALWFGVDVPPDAKPGEHRALVTVRPTNAPPSSVELVLTVLPTELADRGDGDLWRLARLRWLDSKLGAEAEPGQFASKALPAKPLLVARRDTLGPDTHDDRTLVFFGPRSPLADIHSDLNPFDPHHAHVASTNLLPGPSGIALEPFRPQHPGCYDPMINEMASQFSQPMKWTNSADNAQVTATWTTKADPSDWFRFGYRLRAKQDFRTPNLRISIPLRPEIATYFMGLGLRAGPTPTNFTWHWTGPYNSFWIGNAQAGLHVKLLGSTYEGPMQNLYHPKPPPTWFNNGKGGVRISYRPAAPRTADTLSLTPALSRWEREQAAQPVLTTNAPGSVAAQRTATAPAPSTTATPGPAPALNPIPPLPAGEGRGEGERAAPHPASTSPKGEVVVEIFTGPFELKAGEERTFEFSLLVTPVKPLDPATHFRERYWHSTANIPDSANVINVHHATVPNPYINYPFLALDKLREFTHAQQARGKQVKLYYTVRELTSRLPELWALRSLGDEVLAGGPGGGYPWLREHLGGDYTPQWYTQVEGGEPDAAILTSGASRWYNFYVEGLNWLVRNVPIDGVYLDDVAFDRTILKRMRKVMDRARPGCLIDLHSNTAFSKGPAVQYTEYFPYVDRLWFGESFDYDAMTPEQWLVECSGIPFGLMGDMLQAGGNRWRGMVFGMTVRPPWVTDGVSCNPDAIWKVWDDFGIAGAKMIGWWEKNCPVRTGRDDVLATAYVKPLAPTSEPPDYFRPGKTLVALASWAKEKTEVRLEFDSHALDIDPAKAKLVAPEIKDFQPAREWRLDEPISVEPKRGWLIYVTE
jgi:hypothetical protein